MNRVEAAVKKGRCVIVVSGRSSSDGSVLAEMRRRARLPWVGVGSETPEPLRAPGQGSVAPAISEQGGLLVMVDPDPIGDAPGLRAIDALIRKAPHKPRMVIVARSYNPFLFPPSMRLLKTEQVKDRAAAFLARLPVAADLPGPASTPSKEPSGSKVTRMLFAGRAGLLDRLSGRISGGGPTAVVGPPGIGKRWLVEKALSMAAGIDRLPDLVMAHGVGFDTLAALAAEASGDGELCSALRDKDPPAPRELVRLLVQALAGERMGGRVLVVWGLQSSLRRDGSVDRDDRLGMLLRALLTERTALSIVFVSTIAPRFFREGQARELELLEVPGLAAGELHPIFEAYGAGSIPRDRMGQLHQRTLGHPLVTRSLAVAWRDASDPDSLLENPRFLRQARLGGLDRLRAHLRAVVAELDPELRRKLQLAAHADMALPAGLLGSIGVNASARDALLARGLLDGVPAGCHRSYRVHPLVASSLDRRSISDFEVLGALAERLAQAAEAARGAERLALSFRANRLQAAARKRRGRLVVPYPDHDLMIEAIRGMLRGRKVDLARQRAEDSLQRDPGNTELWIAKAQAMAAMRAPAGDVRSTWERAEQLCPTPELFHQHARWARRRKGSGTMDAVRVLERGCACFPDDARLRRRLAGLLLSEGRLQEAESTLREGMALEPMHPDGYSLLGQILAHQESAPWKQAEAALREAVSLAPEVSLHRARLGRLLRHRGMLEDHDRQALWDEAADHLHLAIKADPGAGQAMLELGSMLLDRLQVGLPAQVEQADYLLRKAEKVLGARPALQVARARLLARQERPVEAAQSLRRALRSFSGHVVYAALAELYAYQGEVFKAHREYQQAWEQAPAGAPERGLYRLELNRLQALIDSGAALDIVKQAEAERQGELVEVDASAPGPLREPGNTVVRRSRGSRGRKGGPEAAPVADPVVATAEQDGTREEPATGS